MSKYRFVEGEPPEGTMTLGVVYHLLHEPRINVAFKANDGVPPDVLGYVVVDEDEEEMST